MDHLRLIAELRRELQEEWEYNHSEHCTNMEHRPGDSCHWPRPPVLDDPALATIPELPEYQEPPYLRRSGG